MTIFELLITNLAVSQNDVRDMSCESLNSIIDAQFLSTVCFEIVNHLAVIVIRHEGQYIEELMASSPNWLIYEKIDFYLH